MHRKGAGGFRSHFCIIIQIKDVKPWVSITNEVSTAMYKLSSPWRRIPQASFHFTSCLKNLQRLLKCMWTGTGVITGCDVAIPRGSNNCSSRHSTSHLAPCQCTWEGQCQVTLNSCEKSRCSPWLLTYSCLRCEPATEGLYLSFFVFLCDSTLEINEFLLIKYRTNYLLFCEAIYIYIHLRISA